MKPIRKWLKVKEHTVHACRPDFCAHASLPGWTWALRTAWCHRDPLEPSSHVHCQGIQRMQNALALACSSRWDDRRREVPRTWKTDPAKRRLGYEGNGTASTRTQLTFSSCGLTSVGIFLTSNDLQPSSRSPPRSPAGGERERPRPPSLGEGDLRRCGGDLDMTF